MSKIDQELSDEEKSFHEWLENNTAYVNQNKHSINVMKKLYLAGFSDGFMYRQRINAEQQLQK